MVKRASEVVPELLENFRGGKGIVSLEKFLTPDINYGTGRFCALCKLEPGSSIGYHQHTGEFETYYILKGHAKFNDNGTEVMAGPGDTLICRDGDFHAMECAGDETCEYIAMIINTNA